MYKDIVNSFYPANGKKYSKIKDNTGKDNMCDFKIETINLIESSTRVTSYNYRSELIN
jgi:hypothetical protein